jgi:acetylornithine deacetylase/succinyl-diaminopimelate desuccinylase-like protein
VNVAATVEGGIFYGVRAATAGFRGDVRLPPGVRADEANSLLEQTVASFRDEHPDVSIKVTTDELYPPSEALGITKTSAIASAARQACKQVLGFAPPDAFFPGATDSFFLQGIANVPTLPALGPGRLREAHQPDEFVSLASLEIAPALLVAVAENYLSVER